MSEHGPGRKIGAAVLLLALPLAALATGGSVSEAAETAARLKYPETRRVDQVDDYHGTRVADPYRWLEDADSEETRRWVEAENQVTFSYLERIPGRDRIRERLTRIWNYEKYTLPFKEGGRYFYRRNDGLQNQSVLYTTASLSAEPRVLLDPNALSKNGTVALTATAVSRDGRRMAYGLSAAGSDWQEFRVRDVETGQDLSDHLKWIKFSGASWTLDNQGFFYSRYDAPPAGKELQQQNFFHKVYYHRVGTPQSEDVLVYHRPDQKEWNLHAHVTEDGRYLLLLAQHGTRRENRIFVKDLKDPKKPAVSPEASPVQPLLPEGDAQYLPIGNVGPVFWFQTDKDAPRGRVITVPLDRPAPEHWKTIVAEATESLESANLVGERLVAGYLKDARSEVRIFTLEGKPAGEIKLPGLGSAGGFEGKLDDPETFYSYTSYTTPSTIYRLNLSTGRSEVFREPRTPFEPSRYETKQVFYRSKDGTRVPMFLTYRKGMKLDGTNPTYLYGYGGFRASMTPAYSPGIAVWMEMGGVFAVANIRGGGEYGREWHQAGVKLKKQNVFDDFIAAAEWLVANRYTSPKKLAIGGGSNGGLLVGACMIQRPDLFAAALPAVGVMDMLRFHKFTIGWAWTSDYGSPDDPEEFKALYAYSPLHNLKPGTKYPATMVTTSDHDDRVVPAHSFKFAAALQAAQAGDAPTLIRIETQAGHGAGKPTSKIIEEAADRWAFLSKVLEVPVPQKWE